MKTQQSRLMVLIASAMAAQFGAGNALAQSVTRQGPANPNAMSGGPASNSSSTSSTSTTSTVTVDPASGVIIGPNGAVMTLVPGTTTVVLPVTGGSMGAGGAISGVVVPANSPQVTAILTAFVGSNANLAGLESGLRNRSTVTLTSAAGNATFVPPTSPLASGDVRQALLLSMSQLSSLGITQPTPQQIQASLIGGTVTSATGQSTALQGVLQLRNRGLNFSQIAQAMVPTTTPDDAAAAKQAQAKVSTAGRATATPAGSERPGMRSGPSTSETAAANSSTQTTGTTGTTSTPTTTSSFSSSGNAGTQSPAAGSPGSTPQGSSVPRGNPSATGGGGLR